MTDEPFDQPLPCGRHPAELIEIVADGVDDPDPAHTQECPHCQAMLVRLRRTWDSVRAAANEPATPPDTLAARAVHRVRSHVRRGFGWVEVPSARGSLRVSGVVLVALTREWLSECSQVHKAEASYDGERLMLEIDLRYGSEITEEASSIRRHVRDRIHATVGAVDVPVDVHVVGVSAPI